MDQALSICRDTLLVAAPDYHVESAGGGIRIHLGGQSFRTDSNLLLLLHAFSAPKPLFQGIQEVAGICKGSMDWMRLLELVRRTIERGLLVDPLQTIVSLESHSGSFAAAEIHIRMLVDEARTRWYQRALRANVGPEDVVVDIGTGTGVLAATAAQAGARHVYAIERVSATARLARDFFADNNIQNVTVIEGDSTKIDLPERGTILVSEIIGNDPLSEGVIPSSQDAVKRLLTPDARLVPGRLRIGASLFQVDSQIYRRFFVSDEMRANWRASYSLDFRVFQQACQRRNAVFQVGAQNFMNWSRLGPDLKLLDIDLTAPPSEGLRARSTCKISYKGLVNAVLIHFDLVAPNVSDFSICPDSVSGTNSWANACIILSEPMAVLPDERLELRYAFTGRMSEVELSRA